MSAEPEAALVTGGGSGIGRAICAALAATGRHVVVADIETAAAAGTAAEVGGEAVTLDVANIATVRQTVAEVDARRPLGVVVANAGVALRRPLVDVEPDEFDALMSVNVRGVFFVVQAALRAMVPRGAG